MKRLYQIAIIAGVVVTPIARKMANEQRGYSAIGGEFFIMPLCLLVALLAHQMCELVSVVIRYSKEYTEEES